MRRLSFIILLVVLPVSNAISIAVLKLISVSIFNNNQLHILETIFHASSFSGHLFFTGKSFSGREFDMMSEDDQREACRKAKLFSRVEPAHKSKIVEYLQKEGAVSAMVSKIDASM